MDSSRWMWSAVGVIDLSPSPSLTAPLPFRRRGGIFLHACRWLCRLQPRRVRTLLLPAELRQKTGSAFLYLLVIRQHNPDRRSTTGAEKGRRFPLYVPRSRPDEQGLWPTWPGPVRIEACTHTPSVSDPIRLGLDSPPVRLRSVFHATGIRYPYHWIQLDGTPCDLPVLPHYGPVSPPSGPDASAMEFPRMSRGYRVRNPCNSRQLPVSLEWGCHAVR